MKNTYELCVRASCPKNPDISDSYLFTIELDRFIEVEKLIDFFASQNEPIFQEDLTVKCAQKFGAKVKSVGVHSDVKTICEVP